MVGLPIKRRWPSCLTFPSLFTASPLYRHTTAPLVRKQIYPDRRIIARIWSQDHSQDSNIPPPKLWIFAKFGWFGSNSYKNLFNVVLWIVLISKMKLHFEIVAHQKVVKPAGEPEDFAENPSSSFPPGFHRIKLFKPNNHSSEVSSVTFSHQA